MAPAFAAALVILAVSSLHGTVIYAFDGIDAGRGGEGRIYLPSSADDVHCESWQFGVETYSVRDWSAVPPACEDYVGRYMVGRRYRSDSAVVVGEAIAYAEGLKLAGDGKEVWVFDIDETSISNLPYYALHGFGAEPYNSTAFGEWLNTAAAPALPETMKLYNKLLSMGIKIVFLTGRREYKRAATAQNLLNAGYLTWEKLILKPNETKNATVVFKSVERRKLEEDEGYVIVGNVGDQWSDLLGSPEGKRTFKLPDPMYYVA